MPVTVGVFDWIDHNGAPLHQLYEERLQLVEAAEAAGFYCYHVAEHHQTPLGMAPSPALFLAAAAQRTRRIRLGPLVFLLPLYSPLRLIEEVCMLDHLTGGRSRGGAGRGVPGGGWGGRGVSAPRARAGRRGAVGVRRAGRTGGRPAHEGTYYRYRDVPMVLRPLQRPYPPLWYATSNIESVPWAAERGLHMVGLGPASAYQPFVERYRAVRAAPPDGAVRLNPHVPEPFIGINRQVVVAETDAEALAIVRAAHPRWADSFTRLWRAHGDETYTHRVNLDANLRHETIIAGSPETVRAQVARLVETTGCNYVICAFAWGEIPHAQALRSLRLFAAEVMPAFQRVGV